MSQFQVKNRKGYTLVNKQKIYLSAHSKDYLINHLTHVHSMVRIN